MELSNVKKITILLALFTGIVSAKELTSTEKLNGWSQVDISSTELQGAYLQIGGSTGVYARCHPDSMDATPDFSVRNKKHICSGNSVHYSGTYGEVLEVRAKKDSRGRSVYAVKVKVTDEGNNKSRHRTRVDQESWVYYNPRSPKLQLYNDQLATTHPLGKYLSAAAKGSDFDIPWVSEPEEVVRPRQNPKDDNREILPEGVVKGEDEIKYLKTGEKRLQPALPGTPEEPVGEIAPEDNRGVVPPSSINMCSYNPQPETITSVEEGCPNRPQQKVGGRWRQCPKRELKDINRHANGELKPWLIDIVTQASKEVSEHATTDVGNSCASPAMMMTLMDQESTFHPMSYNDWDDHGIAQFQLGTAMATAKYVQNTASNDSPMKNAITKGLTWRPSACSRTKTPWSKKVSKSCFDALKKECVQNGRLVASLYCPQYAVRLQAFHIKQICSEPFYVNAKSGQKAKRGDANTINLTETLLGEGDPATEARFIASRYNRGNRIFNSAVHYYQNAKNNNLGKTVEWPTAREYGKLWDARRPASYQRGGGKSDPSGGGNLYGHSINRCYNWRTVGLCGGMKDTVFDQYRKITCEAQGLSTNASISNLEGVK